jgi:hypothetical protein
LPQFKNKYWWMLIQQQVCAQRKISGSLVVKNIIISLSMILEENVKMWCTVSTNFMRNCFHSHQYLTRCARELPQEVLSSYNVYYCCQILTKTKTCLKDCKTTVRHRITCRFVERFWTNQLWHGQKDKHNAQGRIRGRPAGQLLE